MPNPTNTKRPGYNCPECDKMFPTEASLRDHMRLIHHEVGVELRSPGKGANLAGKGPKRRDSTSFGEE